jgi:predicted TIM-barrel fold metal-dependent hydrolase
MTAIDVWMQQPTAAFIGQPIFESLRRWTGRRETAPPPLAATVAMMDQAGVDLGLLAAWHGPQGVWISNDEVAAFIGEYPMRFRGLAAVDLSRPMEAVRELRRCVRSLGFVGLRLVPWLWGLPPDDRRYYPLYAECVALDVPVCLQVGHTGPLMSSEPGRPIPYLENVALEFPELSIVAGHVGVPWTLEILSLATKFENLFIDTSAYKLSRLPAELVAFMRGHGSRKVMFGTNYPMLTAGECLGGLAGLGLDAAATEAFLAGNARRVFRLGAD